MSDAPLILALLSLAIAACDEDKKGNKGPNPNGNSPSSDVRVGFTSLIITEQEPTALSEAPAEPAFCEMNLTQDKRGEGLCLPAEDIELWASGVVLGSQLPESEGSGDPASSGPGRLLGGGSGYAKDGKFDGEKVLLTEADTLRGEDNLFHKYDSKPEFDLVTIEAAYVKTRFSIKGSTWELLVPFFQQPVENESVLKQCYDQGYIDQAKTNATLLSGLGFEAGDFLFCKRADPAVPCEANQFSWLDTGSGTLVSVSQSRPASPKKLGSLSGLNRRCVTPSTDGRPPDASYQMPGLRAELATPIRVYGDFSHGASSKSNPSGGRPVGVNEDEWSARCSNNQPVYPHFIYFLQGGDGVTTTGNKLNVQLNVDASNWIFLVGLRTGDLATATEAQILNSLTTREFFAWENVGFDKIGGVPAGWTATLEASTETVGLDAIYAGAPAPTEPCQSARGGS